MNKGPSDSTKFLHPPSDQLVQFCGYGQSERVYLEIIAAKLDDSSAPLSDFVLALAAKELLRLNIVGPGAGELAMAIGAVVARASKVKDSNSFPHKPTEKLDQSDQALAQLMKTVSETKSNGLRAWRACLLGDTSLHYAARWGGPHLDSVMYPDERTRYCERMAYSAYQMALDAAERTPETSRVLRSTLPPILKNVAVVRSVIAGLHREEIPQKHLLIGSAPGDF